MTLSQRSRLRNLFFGDGQKARFTFHRQLLPAQKSLRTVTDMYGEMRATPGEEYKMHANLGLQVPRVVDGDVLKVYPEGYWRGISRAAATVMRQQPAQFVA
jgi:hypothetical protein